uniref:Coiled-coil domain containing 148 n=1 Tax=Amphiprion percula TaxID=161767 RepID=A0A3P8TMC7_AMPPE
MSGRDVQTFITTYRAEDVEKLTLRMKNGLGSSKYKPVEYKRLQAIVDAKRLESELIRQKVQKTRCAAKATKESSILRQHRQVWSRECPGLQKLCCPFQKYLNSTSDNLVNTEKIPKEVLDADCPYPELQDCLIQAFHSLSERYQSRLQSLQEQLQRTDRYCGWPLDDHQHFQYTLSKYSHDIPNHRALCMDMLLRLFPEKSRQDLVSHERVWDLQCFTQAQLRVMTQQWQRDQEELLVRALVTLQEAKHAHQEELELHRGRQHQQDICLHLREKVSTCSTFTPGAVMFSEHFQLHEMAYFMLAVYPQTPFNPCRRQIYTFYYYKRREVLEQRDQERLANLRSVMEEQANFHCCPVMVLAKADPERMMGDTEAWRSRHLNVKESELQRPLYSINTYTDTQIVSDPRVRVEQALREVGLHHSQYAKEVLSVIKPTKPPRPDTKSILKF